MGDFAVDTALEGSNGRYRVRLAPDWQNPIGPHGGYLSAVALRAAGTAAPDRFPASYACQYVSVAQGETLDVEVTTLREGRRATPVRVTLLDDGRTVLTAQVWLLREGAGLTHEAAPMPEVPAPESLPTLQELMAGAAEGQGPPPSLYLNWDHRPVEAFTAAAGAAHPPRIHAWVRYIPTATFEDPVLDAARTVIPIDSFMFPAATRPHAPHPGTSPYGIQSLDLTVQFHAYAPDQAWLLCEADVPASGRGIAGGYARVWAQDGRLLASGTSQLLWRRMRRP